MAGDELADIRNALRLLTRGFLCLSADEAARLGYSTLTTTRVLHLACILPVS